MYNANLTLNYNAAYIKPCVRARSSSLDSIWLYPSDFGECINQTPDAHHYPCITPMYNGKSLHLKHDLVHSSLSGISIKHYYGKCYQEIPVEEVFYEEQTEMYGSDLFYREGETPSDTSLAKDLEVVKPEEKSKSTQKKFDGGMSSSDNHFEYRDELKGIDTSKPVCMQPRINYRNSFWNVHKPELSKLTWPHHYVTTATVLEHLHEHLIPHGALCLDFHDQNDRRVMLNKELDEYVRLKELLPPIKLPPDEKFIDFVMNEEEIEKFLVENPRCKPLNPFERPPIVKKLRCISLIEDEDTKDRKVKRSKEEFCITIGKHIRKPPLKVSDICSTEEVSFPDLTFAAEEEGMDMFHYNWDLYENEQALEHLLDGSITDEDIDSEPPGPSVDPCPPLNIDEFCRAIRKADFSDLRCHPDDF